MCLPLNTLTDRYVSPVYHRSTGSHINRLEENKARIESDEPSRRMRPSQALLFLYNLFLSQMRFVSGVTSSRCSLPCAVCLSVNLSAGTVHEKIDRRL